MVGSMRNLENFDLENIGENNTAFQNEMHNFLSKHYALSTLTTAEGGSHSAVKDV